LKELRRRRSSSRLRVAQLEDQFHLDRGVQRQLRDADGRAGVETGVSEELAYELRGTVDDLRLAVEARGGGGVACNLDDPCYPVQATGRSRGGGEAVQGAEAGCSFCLLQGYVRANLACCVELAPCEGELAGGEDQGPVRVAGTYAPAGAGTAGSS
jgi:hypothetical protein